MLLLRFYSAARLWPSLCCCVLFTAAFLLQSFCPLPLLVILAPFILFIEPSTRRVVLAPLFLMCLWLLTLKNSSLSKRLMCCLGAPIALLWRFRELPEDLASYGPLPGLLSAATSLLFSYSFVAFSVLLRSLHCCLFVAIILPCAPSCGPCPLYFICSSVC